MLTIAQSIESLEQELENGAQVLRARRRHKDIAVTVYDGTCKGDAERRRFSTTPTSCQTDCALHGALRDIIDDLHDSRSLVIGLAQSDEVTNRPCALQRRLKVLQILLLFSQIEVISLA